MARRKGDHSSKPSDEGFLGLAWLTVDQASEIVNGARNVAGLRPDQVRAARAAINEANLGNQLRHNGAMA